MKLSIALIVAASAQERDVVPDDVWQNVDPQIARSSNSDRTDRRYQDLEDIAVKHWRKQGLTGKAGFDERKYWAYGCHCLMLGDRPMSEMGKGTPTDSLDNGCKAWKDCQKCVRDEYGEQCIGEFVRYQWKYSSKAQDFISRNDVNTCGRALFECDLKFVKDTFDNKDAYSDDFHAFYSQTGFDHESDESCPAGGSVPVDHECCGGNGNPFYWIGLNKKQCVDNKPQDL
jgi:hypothetical protein